MVKKKKSNENLKNIIFIVIAIFVIGIIFIVSNNTNKKDSNKYFYFDTSDFSNITSIGLQEYKASLSFDGKSVIFVCSNENEDCYNTLKNINSVAKDNNMMVEYMNTSELVEEEKNELNTLLQGFEEKEYPYLIVLNGENSNMYTDHLEKNDVKEILKNNKII